jgi:hypothetical protein
MIKINGTANFPVPGNKEELFLDTSTGKTYHFTGSAYALISDANVATTTNDDAAAGIVGEYLETVVPIGSLVSETTATPVDVATLALTAGDWEVSGTVNRVLTGTTATAYGAAISPTANTVPAQAGGSGVGADSSVTQNAVFGATVTGNFVTIVGPTRVKLAAAATIHLVAADTFSAGTVGVFGTIRARRVR